jgi:hypothetical protein
MSLPTPFEDIYAVADGDGRDIAILIDNVVPAQKVGGILLVPDEAKALPVVGSLRRVMKKDQAGGS